MAVAGARAAAGAATAGKGRVFDDVGYYRGQGAITWAMAVAGAAAAREGVW